MKAVALAVALLLAGCAADGNWHRPGADQARSESDYQECRDLAADAVKTQADIDQDIFATRQNDWQRAGIARVQSRSMREQTRDRAAGIVESCMRAKGFAPTP